VIGNGIRIRRSPQHALHCARFYARMISSRDTRMLGFISKAMLMSANELSAERRFSTRARIVDSAIRKGRAKRERRSIDHSCRSCSGLVAFVNRGETIAATENHAHRERITRLWINFKREWRAFNHRSRAFPLSAAYPHRSYARWTWNSISRFNWIPRIRSRLVAEVRDISTSSLTDPDRVEIRFQVSGTLRSLLFGW